MGGLWVRVEIDMGIDTEREGAYTQHMDTKQITRTRSKAKPCKAKLSRGQVEQIVSEIKCGLSYYAAGKNQGVSGATARYWWLKMSEGS